jgi:hypothetical protein
VEEKIINRSSEDFGVSPLASTSDIQSAEDLRSDVAAMRLGSELEEAANLKIKADLMIDLRNTFEPAAGRRQRQLIFLARHSRGLII